MAEASFRTAAHGEVWFPNPAKARVLELMLYQCSATRSAYQAIHKHHLAGNDVKDYVKVHYMEPLNQRYVSDACSVASGVIQEDAIFGGKKNWEKVATGKVSKEKWQEDRNNRLYSRGDRAKEGNPNIRIIGDKILINDPSKRGLWIEGKIFIPEKFKPDWSCYDVRLLHEEGKFRAVIGWAEAIQVPPPDFSRGCIGIDTNPSGLGVAEVDGKGNLLNFHYEGEERIQFAEKGKRDADVKELAKRVVDKAVKANKPISLEKLDFRKKKEKEGKKEWKKFRRMKHNFLFRQIIIAILSRALKERVPVEEVKPAFTSVLGDLKYKKMYSMPIHCAAAMVIARRGMGIVERKTFSCRKADKAGKDGKISRNLEGRWGSRALSEKSWSWLRDCFLKPKPASLTGTCSVVALKAGATKEQCADWHPACESDPTTGRVGWEEEDTPIGEWKEPLETW